jgi:hypothetical protein
MTFDHARHAGKGLRSAPKGCHSSPGLKAWGFLAYFIKKPLKIIVNHNLLSYV